MGFTVSQCASAVFAAVLFQEAIIVSPTGALTKTLFNPGALKSHHPHGTHSAVSKPPVDPEVKKLHEQKRKVCTE